MVPGVSPYPPPFSPGAEKGARHAAWRSAPGDPRSALGWFWADRAYRRLPDAVATLLLLGIGVATVGFGAWALLFVPAVVLHLRWAEKPLDLAPFSTVPPPGPAFAIRLEVWRKGALLGEDAGIATFVDGWLHYEGRRTGFSLRRADARDFDSVGKALGLFVGDQRLRLVPIESLPLGLGADGFGRAFRVWFHSTPVPEGAPILPPRDPHPSGLARAWRGLALTCSAVAPLLLSLALLNGYLFAFAFFGSGQALSWLRTLRRLARPPLEAR